MVSNLNWRCCSRRVFRENALCHVKVLSETVQVIALLRAICPLSGSTIATRIDPLGETAAEMHNSFPTKVTGTVVTLAGLLVLTGS